MVSDTPGFPPLSCQGRCHFPGSPWRKKLSLLSLPQLGGSSVTAWEIPVIVWWSLSQPGVPCHSLGFPLGSWGSPLPRHAALMSLPSLAGLWGPGESQREVSLGRLLGEPDLPGAGLHELHSLPALHRGQREMSPSGALRHGLALSLYIVYIETVIYISACLKYCINVKLFTGEG